MSIDERSMDRVAVRDGVLKTIGFRVERRDTTVFLTVEGRLERSVIQPLEQLIDELRQSDGSSLILDLERTEATDSTIVGLLLSQWDRKTHGCTFEIGAMSQSVRSALDMYSLTPTDAAAVRRKQTFAESTGDSVIHSMGRFGDFTQLAADTTVGAIRDAFRKGAIHWAEVSNQAIFIGSQALPIIALISLLIGLTMAFQSAYQLKAFGVDVFVANLTAIAMVREMGPLMTAILVAGRSGSSIAAEMATMKVSEEIDALTVMGIDPGRFLAIPRLIAIVLTVPLLTVCSMVVGIAGGFLVGVYYVGLSPIAYLVQTIDALVVKDLLTGITKSIVFAWGIGLIGLFYGFQVRGGAEEVGRATTASVVAAIFFIIVADCFFSILFYVLI